MRPIVEIMTVNFSLLALDQIVNNAATILHMSGGQFAVPLVIRMATGAGRQRRSPAFAQPRGLVRAYSRAAILAPATSRMRAACSRPALADPDPVLIFEHVHALQHGGRARRRRAGAVDIDARGDPPRRGRDVSLIAYGGTLRKALGAADGARATRASTPRSSTCACCARSTTATISRRSRGPSAR